MSVKNKKVILVEDNLADVELVRISVRELERPLDRRPRGRVRRVFRVHERRCGQALRPPSCLRQV